MTIIRPAQPHTLHGVAGTFSDVLKAPSQLIRKQTWQSSLRAIKGYGEPAKMRVTLRFDDDCGNGHMSFAITADVLATKPHRDPYLAGGCLHDKITTTFPELAHLTPWHLTSTGGPMHYIGNTTYHAGDLDCEGLRKGEKRQIRNSRTGEPCWELVQVLDGVEVPMSRQLHGIESSSPPPPVIAKYVPWCRVGEGKPRNLAAARSSAVWPDATDEQLCLPKPELEALLNARLPQLLQDFEAAMLGCRFIYEKELTT